MGVMSETALYGDNLPLESEAQEFSLSVDELKKREMWVLWRRVERDGKSTKMPINAYTGQGAKSNAPATWCTYQQAHQAVQKHNCDGVGVMFSQLGDGYVLAGVDIDVHEEGLDSNPLAEEILDLFSGTYHEESPSGKGYHIIFAVRSKEFLPWNDEYYKKNSKKDIECYVAGATNRYFTFTGKKGWGRITDQTETLHIFLHNYMVKDTEKRGNPPQAPQMPAQQTLPAPSDNDIDTMLDVARKAGNSAKFIRLYDEGNCEGYNSRSEADLALCGMLAFYLQGDPQKIDVAFRRSALYRPQKWERTDYSRDTINKAIAGQQGKFYAPAPQKRKQPVRPATDETQKTQKRERLTIDLFKQYLVENHYAARNNEITHSFEFIGFSGENAEHINNIVPIRLKSELEQIYSGTTKDTVADYVYWTAANNVYNPVLEEIEREIAAGETGERESGWDGVDRIEQIYNIFQIDEKDKLSRTLIKKWLMQAYCGLHNDINHPFSLDIVLVFQGGQGIGKTRFFEKLALMPSVFGEAITIDPSDTDSVKAATSKWICELGEIGSTMKKDIDKVKAFLTKATDEYRLPYARDFVNFPRRTSFVGTVNDSEFLIDQTGNRRFATVPIKPNIVIDYDSQIKPFNALQLWVQISELVDNAISQGKTYANCFRLTTEERQALDERNNRFTKPMKDEVEVLDALRYLRTPEEGYKLGEEWQTASQFIKAAELRQCKACTVGKVFTKLGIEKRIVDKRSKTTEYFLPTKKWGCK